MSNFYFSLIPGCQPEVLRLESHTLATIHTLKQAQIELEKCQKKVSKLTEIIKNQNNTELEAVQNSPTSHNLTSNPNTNTSSTTPNSENLSSQQVSSQSNTITAPTDIVTEAEVQQEFTQVLPKKPKKN